MTEILYAGLILIVEQIMFYNLGSPTNFQNFHFFSTPLWGGGGVKKSIFFFFKILDFDI